MYHFPSSTFYKRTLKGLRPNHDSPHYSGCDRVLDVWSSNIGSTTCNRSTTIVLHGVNRSGSSSSNILSSLPVHCCLFMNYLCCFCIRWQTSVTKPRSFLFISETHWTAFVWFSARRFYSWDAAVNQKARRHLPRVHEQETVTSFRNPSTAQSTSRHSRWFACNYMHHYSLMYGCSVKLWGTKLLSVFITSIKSGIRMKHRVFSWGSWWSLTWSWF